MKRIVVLGSGFGGMHATIQLERQFRRDPETEILLISDQNYILFTPLLPQIVSSYTNPRHIVQPVRDLRGRKRFRFRRDTVRSVDVGRRELTLGSGTLEYDSLIVALGGRSETFGIPGVRENTWDYKTLEDAVALREHVLDLCEHADHTADVELRRAMLTFVVVGGGYTGVELICELRDFLFDNVAKRYRGIPREDLRLVLIEATPQILGGIAPQLGQHSRKRLDRGGIEVRTSARVTRCLPEGVEIGGQELISSETLIWAAGVRAHPFVESLPGPHDRIGRAVVSNTLQLEGHPEIFVVGDSAAALDAMGAPRVAPVAIEQGRIAGRNVAHAARGEPLESYEYKSKGMLVSLGMNYAVVQIGPIKFSGYFAWLFWNALHLYLLVGLQKQLQVATDWLLGFFFPRDASIIRRPERCRFCELESAKANAAVETPTAG
jgi:NADH dehydrogenase